MRYDRIRRAIFILNVVENMPRPPKTKLGQNLTSRYLVIL